MSENLDLVRSIYADWERGDFSSAQWAHPDIELVITEGAEAGSWRGLAAMARAWRDYLDAWEGFSVEAEEYREVDDERVLVLDHFGGRGRTSGMELDGMSAKGATLFELADRRVTRITTSLDRDRAFAELGLKG
jgi:ketosteroid isomerase-like protein